MQLALHGFPTRRMGAISALLVLCAITMASLTQCIVVPDTVTGLRAKHGAGRCIAECKDRYEDSLDVEKELHEQNEEACNEDPTCLAREDARHEAAKRRIKQGRRQCQDECHHQGGGNGR